MTHGVKSFTDAETGFTSAAFAVFMCIMLISFCHLRMTAGIIVSAVLTAVFAVIAVLNLKRIVISEEKIEVRPLPGKAKVYTWADISEVGVIGTKVFPKTASNKGGRKYIYFSPKELDEDSRFDLALKWPPKIPYTSFSNAKLEAVSFIWQKEIAYYNTGDMHPKVQ